jgi:DNA-binding CsgD family transcriptional regulator
MVRRQAMRLCPLANVSVPCSEAAPLCPWCASRPERKAEATVQPAPEKQSPGPRKQCVDCGKPFTPVSNHQQRCADCGAAHNRRANAHYQAQHRARHRTKEDAERIQRRTWQLDAAKSRAESLHADGMSPSAIAQKLGCSHHTVLRHLAQPEARWRVGILRRLDMPEPVH